MSVWSEEFEKKKKSQWVQEKKIRTIWPFKNFKPLFDEKGSDLNGYKTNLGGHWLMSVWNSENVFTIVLYVLIIMRLNFLSQKQLPNMLFAYLPMVTYILCHNPSLGLMTKARGCKVVGQEKDPKVTSHALGNAKSVREWTLTLPSELPCWELDSQMDSQIFKTQL
jgi:hypothetical protein